MELGCFLMTDTLKEMLKLWNAQQIYTWVSPAWSDEVVLQTTTRSKVMQAVLDKDDQNWNYLIQCLLLIWKVVPAALLLGNFMYGKLLDKESEMLEASPHSSGTESTSAIKVKGATNQPVVKGAHAADRHCELEGQRMDTAMADILSRTPKKVLVRVPEDTKVVKVIGVTNPQISCYDK